MMQTQSKPNLPDPSRNGNGNGHLKKGELPPDNGDQDSGAHYRRVRNDYPPNPNDVPAMSAMLKEIPEYQPIELKALLPAKYWDMIKALGKADVKGNPKHEAVKAGLRYLVCNAVRHVEDVDDETAEKLHKAEIAERTWIEAFTEIAKHRVRVQEAGDGDEI